MIGNDIIDLNLAKIQSNWQRLGFLQKVFTEKEQNFIMKSVNPALNIWLFWSMKEAVYKAVQRKYKLDRFYNPPRFICRQIDFNSHRSTGVVNFEDEHIMTISVLTSNKIHSFTANTEFSLVSESKNSNSNLLHKISNQLNIPLESLNISKDKEGIPFITYRGDNLRIPFSLSHHGAYSAYAVSLNMS